MVVDDNQDYKDGGWNTQDFEFWDGKSYCNHFFEVGVLYANMNI